MKIEVIAWSSDDRGGKMVYKDQFDTMEEARAFEPPFKADNKVIATTPEERKAAATLCGGEHWTHEI